MQNQRSCAKQDMLNLMSFGYTQEEAENALEVNDYNYKDALQWLNTYIKHQAENKKEEDDLRIPAMPLPDYKHIVKDDTMRGKNITAIEPLGIIPLLEKHASVKKSSVRKKSMKDIQFIEPIHDQEKAIQCVNKILLTYDPQKAKEMLYFIKRYLEEFVKEPWEEKKQRIKLDHKVFKEKVLCDESLLLFESIGFHLNQSTRILHYIMPIHQVLLQSMIEMLNSKTK